MSGHERDESTESGDDVEMDVDSAPYVRIHIDDAFGIPEDATAESMIGMVKDHFKKEVESDDTDVSIKHDSEADAVLLRLSMNLPVHPVLSKERAVSMAREDFEASDKIDEGRVSFEYVSTDPDAA